MTGRVTNRLPAWSQFALAMIVALCFCTALSAQSTTQTVQGLVTDASGAVIPGATVTLTNVATGVQQTTTTNRDRQLHVQPRARR